MMLVCVSELDGHAWLWIVDVVCKMEIVESLKFKDGLFAKHDVGVTRVLEQQVLCVFLHVGLF